MTSACGRLGPDKTPMLVRARRPGFGDQGARGLPLYLPFPHSTGLNPGISTGGGQPEGGASGGRSYRGGARPTPCGCGERRGRRRARALVSARPPALRQLAPRGVCVVSPPTLLGAPGACAPVGGSAPSSVGYPSDPPRWWRRGGRCHRGAVGRAREGPGRAPLALPIRAGSLSASGPTSGWTQVRAARAELPRSGAGLRPGAPPALGGGCPQR